MEYIGPSGRKYELLDFVPYGVMRYIMRLQEDPTDFEANMGVIKELIIEPKTDPGKLPLEDIADMMEKVIAPLLSKSMEKLSIGRG